MTIPVDNEDRELRERLRALRQEPARTGEFSSSLHRRLAAAGAPDEPSLWRRLGGHKILWPALGAATAAALLLLVPLSRRAGSSVELPATKVAVVRLNLTAEVPVESARIQVRLPEGLVFWADGHELAQRSFEWTQPLRAGDNDIPIAVRGQRPGRYRLTVTAHIDGQRVDDEVLLDVVDG